MAPISNFVSTKKQLLHRGELWKFVETEALKALAKVRFSIEDQKLYPPLCKQHIWKQTLCEAITQAGKLLQDFPSFRLVHGLVPYTPMDFFTFHMDAAFKSTQVGKEKLIFLRKLRLEQFLCNVPWGVVHPAQAVQAINTFQEKTLKVKPYLYFLKIGENCCSMSSNYHPKERVKGRPSNCMNSCHL